MKKTVFLILIFATFILCGGLITQSERIIVDKNERIIESLVSHEFKVVKAYYVNNTDTIDYLSKYDKETFKVLFLQKENSDSILYMSGNLPDEFYIIGTLTYDFSYKTKNGRMDMYKGNGFTTLKETAMTATFVTGTYFDRGKRHFALNLTFADNTEIGIYFLEPEN